MPTYWLHDNKPAADAVCDIYGCARDMSTNHYYHYSLKTSGRGTDKALHPENRELLNMAALFTTEELDTLALKGGFRTGKDMLYMGTGRPDGMSGRGSACDNIAQKQKHDLVIKYMRNATGQKSGSVHAYTTKSVHARKLHDTVDNLRAIAMIDWELNQDIILADAYSDNVIADHTMALWFNESRKLHTAPVTVLTAIDKIA